MARLRVALLLPALFLVQPVSAADETDDAWHREQQRQKQGERWFRGYDANEDRRISREEYLTVERKRAEKRFAFIDRDRDGQISPDEAIAAKQKRDKLRELRGNSAVLGDE